MAQIDDEIQALKTLVDVLSPLTEEARKRVSDSALVFLSGAPVKQVGRPRGSKNRPKEKATDGPPMEFMEP